MLIGENDSGKSVFIDAIESILDRRDYVGLDWWRGDTKQELRVALRGPFGLLARVAQEGSQSSSPDFYASKDYGLRPHVLLRLPAAGLTLEGAGHVDESGPPLPDESGSNVPAIIDWILRRDRARFDAIVAAIRSRVPGFDDLHVGTPDPSRRRIELKLDSGLILPYYRLSVGVRLLLFFVVLAFHPTPPRIILLEEPENGVHPRRLKDIVGLLRDVTKGTYSSQPAQVILTTHSPYLLDHVDLATDQVLVFRRQDDGSRTVEPVDRDRLKNFLAEFMLGEVWYNRGEEGLVAKPPKDE